MKKLLPLVLIKTFEILPCFCGIHVFQDSWRPKLGKILNNSDASVAHDRHAIEKKNKNGNIVEEWKCR